MTVTVTYNDDTILISTSDVNSADFYSRTPLHIVVGDHNATKQGTAHLAVWLINIGALQNNKEIEVTELLECDYPLVYFYHGLVLQLPPLAASVIAPAVHHNNNNNNISAAPLPFNDAQLPFMFNNSQTSDVVFVIQQKKIYAHQSVLRYCSLLKVHCG
jgi:hypothetical protein